MKTLLFSFFMAIVSLNACAQQESASLTWYTDMSLAYKASIKEKKPLLLFFTGSDWCGWCHRLQREVFNTSTFSNWATKNVILVELDFPSKKVQPQNIKEQNQTLQQQFNVQGYPTIWFVNVTQVKDGYKMERLKSAGYMAGGPDVWIENAKSIIGGGK